MSDTEPSTPTTVCSFDDSYKSIFSQSEASLPKRDESFYFTNVVFLVEDCLFNVPRIYFERESEVFRGLFTLPPPPDAPMEGLSDRHPLLLEGIKEDDFRQLLRVMYPLTVGRPDGMTSSEWTSVLRLSTMWGFESLRDLAISTLSNLFSVPSFTSDLDPVERACLARDYDVDEWLVPALNALAQREDPLSVQEGMRLGWELAMQVANVRESFVAWNEKAAVGPRGSRAPIDYSKRIKSILAME
ncbi:hypothetical protein FIBSPDRAFT_779866 [Athelia psychrophila]|uniref:BTB domain-containing protein n=1 Tax=Athelia psychrophila TaxID=1759441 RepID=A0A166RND1_9AGAM|nr:hypothetical protein FIBSPDRAFT_779866 [Fibularhizoctonia sp. CBS 109695]